MNNKNELLHYHYKTSYVSFIAEQTQQSNSLLQLLAIA